MGLWFFITAQEGLGISEQSPIVEKGIPFLRILKQLQYLAVIGVFALGSSECLFDQCRSIVVVTQANPNLAGDSRNFLTALCAE